MKILILAHAYPSFLNVLYGADTRLAERSYAQQWESLASECHTWANAAWPRALAPFGYETEVVTINNKPLQTAWAAEHGVRFRAKRWIEDIAEAQIERARPVVILSTTYNVFPPGWIRHIRERFSQLRGFITWCGAPYKDASAFRESDLVLSCIPELVDEFRAMGCQAEHLNHAFYPQVLAALDRSAQPDIALSFIGQIIIASSFHTARAELLERLAQEVPLTIYSPSLGRTKPRPLRTAVRESIRLTATGLRRAGAPAWALARIPVLGESLNWHQAPRPLSPRLRKLTRPGVFGLEMFRTLSRSAVTVNNHIDVSEKCASNMRLFEATGVGTCLLTDWKPNLADLFEPESEVVTYRNADECVERARWLLDHPTECEKIAQAGQQRTLKDHTFSARAPALDSAFRVCLGQR